MATPALAVDLDIDIKGTSIEQLMQINVTTVSRQDEEWQTTPAAAYVLTREDLQRAHVTNIPDALRLVPGVEVARIDANKWAVSIRGFNARTANKLLVMIDGRSIYDPLFGGVFWESRGELLDNIERVEVVRGPGGTLWGSNAVNGVINIITRNAADTQGTLVEAGVGSEEGLATVRHGWQVGPNASARMYAQHNARETGYSPLSSHDDARLVRGGFRVDWAAGATDQFMLKADAFDGTFGERLDATRYQDVNQKGNSLTARWTRDGNDGSQTRMQFWYDQFDLDNLNLGESRDTYDVELQHAWRAGDTHRFVVGTGYRRTRDEIRDGPLLGVEPDSRSDALASAFVHDEMTLAERSVRVQFGVKFEHNDYSGAEWQPSVRAAWVPDADRTVWAAASRAVRSPSRLESDVVSPFLTGNQDFRAEKLDAYELGYRQRVAPQVWVDVATFYNVYRDLLSIEGSVVDNKLGGTTSGVEIATRWQVSAAWRLDLAYTYLSLNLRADADSTDTASAARTEGNNPRHQWSLRSAWNPRAGWQVDADLRYVSGLEAPAVPSYLVADVGMTWRIRKGLDLRASARDLFDSRHPEQSGVTTTEVQRSVLLTLRWEI
jgi:iron complex outermembrane receptor protein